MTAIQSFAATAAGWQNFYIVVGTAAATLVGLMFVAITFGASLVTPESAPTARAFLDPTFTHFVQVLLTACTMVIPSMGPRLLGVLSIVLALVRGAWLVGVHKQMKVAHARAGDIELSDWISGVIVPGASFAALFVAGVLFLAGAAVAFEVLAAVVLVVLATGIYGAWEIMMWMAITRAKR